MESNIVNSMKRCAVVGIVGRTNSGKSTLLNRIVGEKVSIVSPTVQTTRNTVRAILTQNNCQLVFLDTPGLHKSESTLGTLMNRMARTSSAGVDILMIVFDGSAKPRIEDEGWMAKAFKNFSDKHVIFVLNKSDKTDFNPLPYREALERNSGEPEKTREAEWLECSAARNKGIGELIGRLAALAPPADDYFFSEDILTDYPRKLAIADVIREKFLAGLRDEIPHELGVLVEHIVETPVLWDISVTIYVNRPSQKGIVIGPKAERLKKVRQQAERELREIYSVRINLELRVKAEKNWFKNFRLLEQMGYAGKL